MMVSMPMMVQYNIYTVGPLQGGQLGLMGLVARRAVPLGPMAETLQWWVTCMLTCSPTHLPMRAATWCTFHFCNSRFCLGELWV